MSSINGRVDASLLGDTKTDIYGTNVGGYVDVYYKHESFPLFGRARWMGGDVDGLTFSLCAAF